MISKLRANRHIIWSLAKNDFKSRYLGSFFGGAWAFALPLVNLAIMWFAFQHGFRASPVKGMPFILWLVTGLFPWSFFSDAVSSATNSILNKSFLVKKVVFDVEILPFIQVLASAVVFVFLFLVMILLFAFYGIYPNIHWLQLPYYIFCLWAVILSMVWMTSSVVVFYRDLGHVISVCLQLGFWITPIFWSPEMLPAEFKFITLLNPVNYVVTGYRDAMMGNVWFWDKPTETAVFWLIVISLSLFGRYIFARLRPHFADVI